MFIHALAFEGEEQLEPFGEAVMEDRVEDLFVAAGRAELETVAMYTEILVETEGIVRKKNAAIQSKKNGSNSLYKQSVGF